MTKEELHEQSYNISGKICDYVTTHIGEHAHGIAAARSYQQGYMDARKELGIKEDELALFSTYKR